MIRKSWVKFAWVLGAIAALVLPTGSLCLADSLPAPYYYGMWQVIYAENNQLTGSDLITSSPGSFGLQKAGVINYVGWDGANYIPYQDLSALSFTLTLTPGIVSSVAISGSVAASSDNPLGPIYYPRVYRSMASMEYWVRVQSRVPDPPSFFAQLSVLSDGSLGVSDTQVAGMVANASLINFGSTTSLLRGVVGGGSPATWFDSTTHIVTGMLGQNIGVYSQLLASAGTWSDFYGLKDGNATFDGAIDPEVMIDPNWWVEYHGQRVPGSQLYCLEFSPGFGPAVPLPPSFWLLGSGLLGLVGLRRFWKG
jgi:hypothetical protein